MTPKEKAKELIDKFNTHARYWDCYWDVPLEVNHAKQCALICIDERIEEAEWWSRRYKADNVIKYLKEIKTEIEKL